MRKLKELIRTYKINVARMRREAEYAELVKDFRKRVSNTYSRVIELQEHKYTTDKVINVTKTIKNGSITTVATVVVDQYHKMIVWTCCMPDGWHIKIEPTCDSEKLSLPELFFTDSFKLREVKGDLAQIPELVRMYNIVSDYIDDAFYEHRNRLRHARNYFESALKGDC